MKIGSFDIGLKTCSVAIETYTDTSIKPPKTKYVKGGEATPEMKAFIEEIRKLGCIEHLEKKDLGDKKTYFSGQAFRNLYAWCEELDTHLSGCDIILIEQQMRVNNIAQALMYHLQACLMIKYADKTIKLYPSKNKTRILGAPLKVENEDGKMKKVTKYQRKKWSCVCADEMLKARGDDKWHTYIFKTNKSKKDDLSDVLMQTLSFVVDKCK
jgi:hypothetical protein